MSNIAKTVVAKCDKSQSSMRDVSRIQCKQSTLVYVTFKREQMEIAKMSFEFRPADI